MRSARHRSFIALPLVLPLLACTAAPPQASPAQVVAPAANSGQAGNPVTPGLPEELAHLQRDAERGDANAQLLLAERLLAGEDAPRDIPGGVAWLERAADQGFAPAQDLLATLYYRGIGVTADYARARLLMERAVEHQYLPAINNLAWLLATCPDDTLRDGTRAISLLSPVMDRSPQMLDTLAAAYAETGDFEQAMSLQQQAISALGNVRDRDFAPFIERLAGYSRNEPWRDPRSGAAPRATP